MNPPVRMRLVRHLLRVTYRGELIGYQPVLDVGVQLHTEDIRVPNGRYVTVSTSKREKKTSEGYGDDGDESLSSSVEADL